MAILLSAGANNVASAQLFGFNPFKKAVKLALVLPFNANGEQSRDCMDFYCGALMAVEDKKNEGASIDLKVIDFTGLALNDSFQNELDGLDAVIGPFAAADLKKVQPFCRKAGAALISPLDQKAAALAADDPAFFQVATSHREQIANLVGEIETDAPYSIKVLYKNPSEQFTKDIFAVLDSLKIKYKPISYNVQRGRTITDSLKRAMTSSVAQHVIIASEDEAFASDAARNLSLLKNSIPLQVYGSNKLRNFETIDAEALFRLGLKFSTSYYTDYRNTMTQEFVLKYRALYNAEPSQYAISGYDIFYFFISAFNDLGKSFYEFIPYYTLGLIQSNILFRKTSEEGGYVNTRTRDVQFKPDYSVEVH